MSSLGVRRQTISLVVMIFIGVLLATSFVSAAPPATTVQQLTTGYNLVDTPQLVLEQDHDFQYNFFLYNITNGIILTNSSANCTFYLADLYGEVLFNSSVPYLPDGHWGVVIEGGNFTRVGEYAYGTKCQGVLGGTTTGLWTITNDGLKLLSEQITLYMVGLIFLVLLIFGTVYIINTLPSKDSTDEEGTILQVSLLKHLRSILWILIWALCLAIMFVLSNLFLAYLSSMMLGNLFWVLYQIMFWVTIIGIPIYFIWILYSVFKDKEMQDMINRGVDIKGTP